MLGGSEINVTQDEQDGKDPHQRVYFFKLSSRGFHQRIRNNSKAETRGDAEGKRCHEHSDEGGQGLAELLPANMRNGLRH